MAAQKRHPAPLDELGHKQKQAATEEMCAVPEIQSEPRLDLTRVRAVNNIDYIRTTQPIIYCMFKEMHVGLVYAFFCRDVARPAQCRQLGVAIRAGASGRKLCCSRLVSTCFAWNQLIMLTLLQLWLSILFRRF